MRILLDESVPRRLASLLVGHEVKTVVDMGWAGMSNGQLLSAASADFDVFVTVDKNLPHQQTLERYAVSVVVLDAPSNDLASLAPLVPQLLEVLRPPIRSGSVITANG